MLEIKNLHASVDGKEILKGIDLTIASGEVNAIMGPNGSGKSTLSYILTGRQGYEVTEGEVLFNGANLLEMEPEERAAAGVFLAFQYPVEIPGVLNSTFLKEAVNAVRRARGDSEMDAMQFLKILRAKCKELHMSAIVGLHRAGPRTCAGARPNRSLRRQRTGKGVRGKRLRGVQAERCLTVNR